MPVHHTRRPASRPARRMPVRDVLCTTIAFVLVAAFSAQAQDTAPVAPPANDASSGASNGQAPVTLDNITVIGQRASLNRAVQAKQMSDHVVEVISADTMGQMPNVTVAEALVRLPGVNGTRDRGNESLATVRGLGPRMTMGTVNGREIASSEPNRAVRWEVFPTEVVSTVKVYKTQSADLVAGGLAATVDISTISPLDYTGPGFVGTAGPVFYDHAKDVPGYTPWGSRFGASWVHKLNDNLAVALGATYQKQKNAGSSIGSWGYTDAASARDINGDGTPDPTPWGAADQLKLIDQTRTGAMGTVQWRSGNLELKLDGLYSRIAIEEDQLQNWFNGLAYSVFSSGANPYTTPGSSYTIVGGDVVAGTLANSNLQVDHVVSHYNEIKTLAAGGLNAKWSGDVWTLAGDLSFSQAKRDNEWRAVRFGSNPDTLSFDFRRTVKPTISTSSDAPEWGLNGQTDPQALRDKIAALALNASRAVDAGPFTTLEVGARAAQREKQNRRFLSTQSNFDQPISAYQGLIYPVTMPGLNVPTLTGGNLDDIARIGFGGFDRALLSEQMLDHWAVKEDVREAFAKAVFSAQLFGTDVTGNIGVRLVNTKTDSQGFDSVGSTIQPSSASKQYTDVLPSATLNFLIDEQRILRMAVAKVIARPPLDELRTGRRLDDPNVTVGQLTGSGGNPQLDPFRATQLDVSYEWYFHKEALAALAVYRKEVDSSIGYRTDREVINGLDYLVSAPFNGGGGHINGVELTLQTPFFFIPHLENFGVYSNYSLVDSNLKEFSPEDNPLPLSGLARRTGTFDLWYSNGTFEARVGYKYHSPYTVVYGWNAARLARLQSEGTVDLSLNWQYSKQLGFRFQASNLTNEPLRAYTDNRPNRLANQDDGGYQLFGRRYQLEATYRF
ncbi:MULTISPECIES: TonB-dependent receptor [Xanthomonas]|uniref:TonB-dependent receptor n=1 Tax=Xanthomonas cucurbitae TaxID=56453 RepID=A0A2S7DWF3_9XANT|nr:TonB-dependent receptor [Xanthomonas cucurbitae]PPU78168.1 TonB-dependent receptor [Xanthomonas cucurbitae]QHG86515.1 TonB-dependent receptor [Xanthomonas cucurbitae]WDM68776.1 TonB-dependent receptor [Xanthomonas cucurbitae]WDM72648.1 TonB-dependent receptor [Xanthomonas cucurbitae]WDM76434.1 TonB-dependent receptor [Xanthomonas cucurbitae]